jgi:hypothetical protein
MAGLWTKDGFHCQITNDAALEIAELLKKGITQWGPFEVSMVKPDSSPRLEKTLDNSKVSLRLLAKKRLMQGRN